MEEEPLKEETSQPDYTYENRMRAPYLEKEMGDKKLKEENYDEALKHFSKAIMAIKILVQDNAFENSNEADKYVREVGVYKHIIILDSVKFEPEFYL
jgi:hypothetical protein